MIHYIWLGGVFVYTAQYGHSTGILSDVTYKCYVSGYAFSAMIEKYQAKRKVEIERRYYEHQQQYQQQQQQQQQYIESKKSNRSLIVTTIIVAIPVVWFIWWINQPMNHL